MSPSPAVPEANLQNLAEWGPRALGILIDSAITWVAAIGLLIVGAIAAAILGRILPAVIYIFISILVDLAFLVVSIGSFFYFAWQIGKTGQSPGMRVAGVKCVSGTTGETIGTGMAIGRGFATALNSLAIYLGWLWPLWDEKRQTFADKIVGTEVVVVPKSSFSLKP